MSRLALRLVEVSLCLAIGGALVATNLPAVVVIGGALLAGLGVAVVSGLVRTYMENAA